MYYITKKDSETGKKFLNLNQKIQKADQIQESFYKKHGLIIWFSSRLEVLGCFSKGEELIDIPNFKRKDKLYYPKKNTKEGKLIEKELKTIEKITSDDLRDLGINNQFDFVGIFIKGDLWGLMTDNSIQMPIDCNTIQEDEFIKIFPESKNHILPF